MAKKEEQFNQILEELRLIKARLASIESGMRITSKKADVEAKIITMETNPYLCNQLLQIE